MARDVTLFALFAKQSGTKLMILFRYVFKISLECILSQFDRKDLLNESF